MHFRRTGKQPAFSVVFGILALTLTTCGPGPQVETSTPKTEITVAVVDGRPIAASALQEEMRLRQMVSTSALEAEYFRRLALDTLITRTTIRLEAEKMSFADDYAVRAAVRQLLMQRAADLYIQEKITPRLAVTDADIDTYWHEHPEQFTVRQLMVNIQQIMINEDMIDHGGREVPPEYREWTGAATADDIFRRFQSGEDLDSLAYRYSNDVASRAQAGKLGWHRLDSALTSAWQDSVFAFPTGITQPPFYTDGAYYVIRINGRRQPGEIVKPDETMKEQVATFIGKQRMNDWMDNFKDSLRTVGNLYIIDSTLDIPIDSLADGLPMAISNGTDTTFGYDFRTQSFFFKTEDGSRNFTLSDKRRLLEALHGLQLITIAMRDLGYLDRQEIVKTGEEYLISAAEMRIRAESADRAYTPTDEEITNYYQEHLADYLPEQPLHVQHIVLDNPDTAWAVKRQLDAGADFIDLAQQYYHGDPEMADVTYDLGFIAPDDLPAQFFAAAMELKVGEISAPIQTEWGYHIIRVLEIKEGTPLSKARQEIRSQLVLRHKLDMFKAWREALLARHVIEINQEALAAVPVPESAPAGSPAPSDSLAPSGR